MSTRKVIGLDLGQAQDPTALAVLECVPLPESTGLERAIERRLGLEHVPAPSRGLTTFPGYFATPSAQNTRRSLTT